MFKAGPFCFAMEPVKHECGVAMIRLRKPLQYYMEKYGTPFYPLLKLYLLMEKQHNRGQEGAGLACVKLSAPAGEEFMFRERAEGSNAITEIFASVYKQIGDEPDIEYSPFLGECYMGHLRYSTTGRSGISNVHPFLRRSNYKANTLSLCGNFNLTNMDEIFEMLSREGQHPRRMADTALLLEQLGHALDCETARMRERYAGMELSAVTRKIEDEIQVENILRKCAPSWDGGFVICGLSGSGEMFAVRDPWGIRGAHYFIDDEIVVLASERPVIQTVMNVDASQVSELQPGEALIVGRNGMPRISRIMEPFERSACSFERIYFSRGSDMDIYRERKALGAAVVPQILKSVDNDMDNTIFSFIPNTAEVAFLGMLEELNRYLDKEKLAEIESLPLPYDIERVARIIGRRVRGEKVAIKDIKLRTFIAESSGRNNLANHVYDVTYGVVRPGLDNLVVIDDSIVRGTTLRESIISILARLKPKKLVIVSSAPQIRYPDFYGIDMSNIGDLVAFRAAVALTPRNRLETVYRKCKEQECRKTKRFVNYVSEIYDVLSPEDISAEIVKMLTPADIEPEVDIIFPPAESLRKSIPNHTGDWYFTGNYPTQGGLRRLNGAFIDFYRNTYRK